MKTVKVIDKKVWGREVVFPFIQKVVVPKSGYLTVSTENAEKLKQAGLVEFDEQETQTTTTDISQELESRTVAELKELASEFPKEEWGKLTKKSELVEYLISKLNAN